MNSKSSGYFSSARTEIEPLLPDRIGSILEIGCGSGATLTWLRTVRPIDFAMGVELVPDIAAQASSVFDEIMCGNIETMPLAMARKFDVIMALDVLEHLVDPWGAVRSLSELLAPKGVFLSSVPNAAHWNLAVPLFWRGSWEYAHDGIMDKTHLRFFTESTARAMFEDEGFVITQMAYVKNYPGKSPSQRWRVRRYLRYLIPDRLTNFQFLLRAEKAR